MLLVRTLGFWMIQETNRKITLGLTPLKQYETSATMKTKRLGKGENASCRPQPLELPCTINGLDAIASAEVRNLVP